MIEDAKPIIAEQIIDNPQAAFADVGPCTPESEHAMGVGIVIGVQMFGNVRLIFGRQWRPKIAEMPADDGQLGRFFLSFSGK